METFNARLALQYSARATGGCGPLAMCIPRDEQTVSRYFRPRASFPSGTGCAVVTSRPLVLPAMMALFGMVS